MPPVEDIQQFLIGAWRMMMGRRDGLALLDISADGFWNSFFAIVIAVPALIVGWVVYARELGVGYDILSGRVSVILRLAVADIATWLIPIAALAVIAGPVGMRDRFVHYVVANNWGSAISAWMLVPAALIRLVVPGFAEVADLLSLMLFAAVLILSWRLTNLALDKGPGAATVLFFGMLIGSFAVLFMAQGLLGLAPSS